MRSFKACVDKYLSTNGYKSYCSVLKLGKLYFDDKVHTLQGIEHIYKLAVENYKLQKENDSLRENESVHTVKNMIKKQCSKSPVSLKFDFRTLIRKE